jgi:hypothetical protein
MSFFISGPARLAALSLLISIGGPKTMRTCFSSADAISADVSNLSDTGTENLRNLNNFYSRVHLQVLSTRLFASTEEVP